jgi:hypothetical protein
VAIVASAVITLAAVAVIVVALSRNSTTTATTAAAPPPTAPSTAVLTSTPPAAPGDAPAAPGGGPPTITKGAEQVVGRDITVAFTVASPAGGTPPTCQGTVNGTATPVDCGAGRLTVSGVDHGGTYDIRVVASNASGEASIQSSIAVPLATATVIHACYPPPCERIKLHAAPRRVIGEPGPTVYDGDQLTITCWTEGDSLNSRFDEAGRPTRWTTIFYQVDGQRWIWAPFVTDFFETPIPGIRRC